MMIFSDNRFHHHAWCVDGVCRTDDELRSLKSAYQIPETLASITHTFEQMLVEDAHMLRHVIGRRAAEPTLHIIIARRMTRDAQNTLLKLIEEPAPQTAILFIIEHLEHILPTISSRLIHLGSTASRYVPFMKPTEYLAMTWAERHAASQKAVDKKASEPLSRSDAHRFIDALEKTLTPYLSSLPDAARIFHHLGTARDYLADTGSSVRMLLDHVSMAIPEKLDLGRLKK